MSVADVSRVLPDIPRIYTALAEWLACLLCIIEMKRRISGWRLITVSAAALVIQSLFLIMTSNMKGALWMFCMAGAVGLMYLFLCLCCDMPAKVVGYYCVRAFVAAEFAASLEWQLECYAYFMLDISKIWCVLLILIPVYALVYLVIWFLYRKYISEENTLTLTNKELIACVIIGLAIFLISNLGFISTRTPFVGEGITETFNVRTLIDLGGVAILYAYHVQRIDLRVRHELACVQNILHNQYVQYQHSKEAMEIINYKYHDLKHHIIALRAEDNDQKRRQYLDGMEAEIQNYETQNKTGNKVLDTLLTTKNLYCLQNQISMTSVVDGGLFSFMDVMDICSIFGNALDNAIECEKKIAETEKRMIHVSAFSQKSFLILRFENYCEEQLDFEADLPVTTKEEARFHGYGLKSLRYTVRKYGGEVDVGIADNWFNLKILIPR